MSLRTAAEQAAYEEELEERDAAFERFWATSFARHLSSLRYDTLAARAFEEGWAAAKGRLWRTNK